MTDPADLLREHGLPVTAQRIAVLRAVSGRPHGTADAIAADVRDGIGAISRQSVYDSLAILAGKGLIRRIEPAGSPARYEARTGTTTTTSSAAPAGKRPMWTAPPATLRVSTRRMTTAS